MEGLERLQNNQVKKMGIGRLGLIFFMIGGMLFVVLRSGQTTYLVIQVVLLFSALFLKCLSKRRCDKKKCRFAFPRYGTSFTLKYDLVFMDQA